MQNLGVKDCKQMSDKSVLAVGAKLRALLGPTGYAVVKLGPAAYNRLYAKMRNINRMLAWAHGTAIEELLEKRQGCPRVVVDQFAPTEATILRALKERGKKAKVEQRHKAESDIAVAAASVIARELFLRDIMKMTDEVFGPPSEGRESVPAGSSDPRVRALAEEMVRKNGPLQGAFPDDGQGARRVRQVPRGPSAGGARDVRRRKRKLRRKEETKCR